MIQSIINEYLFPLLLIKIDISNVKVTLPKALLSTILC